MDRNTKAKKSRIVVDNKIHFGQPCVANTRIPVYSVLELIQANISFTEIVEKFHPDLTLKDIEACVEYATQLVKAEEIHIGESSS